VDQAKQIEISIINALVEGMVSVDILEVGDDKLSSLVKSRIDSFSAIKNFSYLAKISKCT
jgi:hypothetical protein